MNVFLLLFHLIKAYGGVKNADVGHSAERAGIGARKVSGLPL